MKKLKSITSIKIRVRFNVLLRTFFYFIVFLFLNVSVSAQNWKEYSLRELIGRLKYYTYAKVAQSLRKEYLTDQEQMWEDWDCVVPIPELPGPFFCGLLKQQFPSELEPEVSVPEMVPLEKRSVSPVLALNPNIKVYKNIQLYSGTTISGKNVVKISSEEDSGESLRAFYLNNGRLSHYEFRDRIIVFDWSGSKLKAILDIKVDSMFRPLSGREIILP
ncbi:LIC_11883 family protein [Leptospira kirschneri]|uniref:Uncharacterized protein n=2 Tax=Leptospira kirschneri TaxID=29507 RepID=A0A1T1DKH5_9LEPT|nr:hypothetical protein [Leptospira kirschneri]EMO75433.1 hypothetical protein LEP1GSC127_0885 [Leptospira kirschneri str. 200801925]EJO70774.1 hypothetical protein LEP1GSC044_2169 [Leptospira kirschneri serovar Grippotyphosa str. RM52]EKO51075.1 hypothetical protein LEP1GSC131_2236 [Leptospira kirschneri str. 200802841]EKP07168.1 hypothetical protein LEP1GSC018_2938 [Leptospira kirschneri str. 2008720114]EKQ84116.1 hypothetical protein LEP1GSC064_0322 [Leptospira kirschneri serovar Grippotyph